MCSRWQDTVKLSRLDKNRVERSEAGPHSQIGANDARYNKAERSEQNRGCETDRNRAKRSKLTQNAAKRAQTEEDKKNTAKRDKVEQSEATHGKVEQSKENSTSNLKRNSSKPKKFLRRQEEAHFEPQLASGNLCSCHVCFLGC